MAAELTTDLLAKLGWNFSDALDLATVRDSSNLEYKKSLGTGTGNNLADRVWHDKRTLVAAGNDNLDLAGGLTNSIFGGTVTITFVKVKGILIVNEALAAGEDLIVGNGGVNSFLGPFGAAAHTLRVEADSCLLLTNRIDGWTVTASTGDILRINNAGAASNIYKIAIIGTSA